MSVLASLITAVWQLFKRTKKKKDNTCSKILDDNKSIEQFKDKTPLLKVDYTERRWEKIIASTPELMGHCCNENCRCQIVKEYTKALDEGDTQKAQEIVKGDFQANKFVLEIYDEEPKVKMCQKDIDRLRHSMDKIERELKNKNRSTSDSKLRRSHSEKVSRRKSTDEKYHQSVRSTPRKMKCCSNENCGCHIIKEFTRAQSDGNEELMDKIRKGMYFDPDFVSKNQVTRKDTERDSTDKTFVLNVKRDSKENRDPFSETKSGLKSDKIFETHGQLEKPNELDLTLASKKTSQGTNLNVQNEINQESTRKLTRKSSCPNYTTYSIETFKSSLPEITVKSRKTSCPTYTTFDIDGIAHDDSEHPVKPVKEEVAEDLDNSFHHTIPHYYAENENALNRMKHEKKTKKRKKKTTNTPKTKTVKTPGDPLGILTSTKDKIKRYNSLMEEESDSSWTDGAEYVDGFATS